MDRFSQSSSDHLAKRGLNVSVQKTETLVNQSINVGRLYRPDAVSVYPPPLLRPFEGQYAFSKDIAVRLLYDTRLHDTIPVLACTDEIKSEPRDIIRDDGVILHHTF